MRCINCGNRDLTAEEEVCPQCGVYLPSLMRDILPLGTLLNEERYRIEDILGRGGYGVTYQASHARLGQRIAIKEFYPQNYALREGTTGRLMTPRNAEEDYQKWLQRFEREGEILANITHPHIVRVQDLFNERNTAYLVMELLIGSTLKDEITPGKGIAENRVIEIMNALVSALAQAHQREVYHLDLKPDNVMVTREGRIVLIDFGAARRNRSYVGTMSRSHSTHAFTEAYAPPELLAKGTKVSAASDIFELGMVLHELLTGECPPAVMSRYMGLHKAWRPSLAEPWQGMLESALQLEPSDRPEDIAAWWGRYRTWEQRQAEAERQIQAQAAAAREAARQREEQAQRQAEAQKLREAQEKAVALEREAARLKAEQERQARKPLIILKRFEFTTVKLAEQSGFLGGKKWVVQRQQSSAKYFIEELGNDISLEMVSIPGSSFMMGGSVEEHERVLKDVKVQSSSNYSSWEQWLKWELPQHRVNLQGYYLGKYAITQAQYEAIMGSNPSNFKGTNRPVENVSWNDAQAFCQKLSAKTGKEYRLPSESEWEYACRAGTTTPFHYGATLSSDVANYNGTYTYGNGVKGQYRQQTTEVGIFPANEWGLYDMHGNVWEWCADAWYDSYSGAPSDGSARKSNSTDAHRLLRGGSWRSFPWSCRSAYRSRYYAADRYDFIGFRVALSSLPGFL